jgi:hypothetical protein
MLARHVLKLSPRRWRRPLYGRDRASVHGIQCKYAYSSNSVHNRNYIHSVGDIYPDICIKFAFVM